MRSVLSLGTAVFWVAASVLGRLHAAEKTSSAARTAVRSRAGDFTRFLLHLPWCSGVEGMLAPRVLGTMCAQHTVSRSDCARSHRGVVSGNTILPAMPKTTRLAIDVGGTFTDVVELAPDTGTLRVDKVSTTPDAPATGVLQAFGLVGEVPDVALFTHGTTLGLN